ncbi:MULTISPECIES: hypothetical protein [unclassified Nocardia]|uniref:TPR repeat region-containing protein n=1 Tax=unclassified Nocardia TaxID=2637762 RepID=UPI001CE4339E|nr:MULTISPECIES: hypothetical protein [unclassified Nocardia]
MTPKSWIEQCDPSVLTATGDSWIAFGTDLEHLFDRYVDAVTKVNGTYWEGQCAQAAHDRATADRKTIQTIAEKINAVAQRAKQGYDEIDAPLRRARGALIEANRRGYTIADNLALSIPPGKSVSDDDKRALLELQNELNGAFRSTIDVDSKVREDLNNARSGLRAAFVSTAALGADKGKSDGTDLTTQPVNLSAEGIQRLIDAGQLTPDQIAALQRGDTATVPASQMEYLNGLSRALDGKSPQEIQQIMSKLPPDAQKALANSFQIISNPSINAGALDDKTLPNNGKGSLGLLPKQIRESLTREDLVTNKSKYLVDHEINLNGVADNQAIAKMIGTGDPQYRLGSDVDRKLLEVGSKYLDGYEQYKNSSHGLIDGTSLKIDGGDGNQFLTQRGMRISEDMFDAAGKDKAAVQELVTGKDHDKLFKNIFTHEWTDQGTAVSSMFKFDHDAVVHDPNNLVEVKTSEQQGKIMCSVAEYIAGDGDPDKRWKELTGIDYQGKHNVGALNPALIKGLSEGMSPYVDALAGHQRPELPGFDTPRHVNGDKVVSWLDPEGNHTYKGTANIFALMDTDSKAGNDFNSAALASVVRNEAAYALNPNLPGATDGLMTAGRLSGLVDKGLFMDSKAQHDGDYADAKDMWERKRNAYDGIKSVLGRGFTESLPFGKSVGDIITAGGDDMKAGYTGEKPEVAETRTVAAPNFTQRNYEVLSFAQIPPELQNNYQDLFENGKLRSWESIQLDPKQERLTSDVAELFNMLGRHDGHGETFRNSYSDITRGIQGAK